LAMSPTDMGSIPIPSSLLDTSLAYGDEQRALGIALKGTAISLRNDAHNLCKCAFEQVFTAISATWMRCSSNILASFWTLRSIGFSLNGTELPQNNSQLL
jgi:hypothetical protein